MSPCCRLPLSVNGRQLRGAIVTEDKIGLRRGGNRTKRIALTERKRAGSVVLRRRLASIGRRLGNDACCA